MTENNKIFGLGLSRTGTTSLAAGLDLLDIHCLHYSLAFYTKREELFGIPESYSNTKGWQRRFILNKELKASRTTQISSLFEKYSAFCDLPFPAFYQELDKKYSGSRFILTTRPLDGWLKSMEWMLSEGEKLWNWGYLDYELLNEIYGTTVYNETKLREYWDRYHSEVRGYFKDRPRDFLEMDLSKGDFNFDLLCRFLDKPVLEMDFPKTNSSRKVEGQKNYLQVSKSSFPIFPWMLDRIFNNSSK